MFRQERITDPRHETAGSRRHVATPTPQTQSNSRWTYLRRGLAAFALFLALPATWASAAGLLVPTGSDRSLAIDSQQVAVRIDNGIAVTTVTQVFKNDAPQPLEALYTFPVPREASVSNFSMWINGKEVVGEVLERQRAREIYRQVTRVEKKDPGLLEQVDFKTFEMRVFPVPAKGEQRIQISYYQPVDYDSGFATYVYPLEMDDEAVTQMKGEFSLLVDVASNIPLKKIASPSHKQALVTAELTKDRYRASIESAQGNLDRDFVLVYELERERLGLDVLTSRTAGDDGYFMLLLTPGAQFDETQKQVNVTFVIDASGSMRQVGKLDLARQAAGLAIGSLRETDTFNIIAFNIAPRPLFDAPLPATPDNLAKAREFLAGLEGRGGTDLAPALDEALAMQLPDARNAIVLLSDGQATASDDHSSVLAALARSATQTRIFSFGIGNEVNRPLLDRLAAQTGGLADYVSGQDEVERKILLIQAKLSSPVATDLELSVDGVKIHDVTPSRLPNLYRGQQLVLMGRYSGAGEAKLTLSGTLAGKQELLSETVKFPESDGSHPQIQRMWAWRQVDERLAQLRGSEQSPSLIDQVVKLGVDYSIVTPFTAFLVLENESEYQRFSIERKNAARISTERQALDQQFAAPARRSAPRDTAPPAEEVASATPANRNLPDNGGGGGGAVEWLFLAALGALAAGRLGMKRSGGEERS